MATYLRDQYVGSVMNLSVTAPNGSIIYNWDKILIIIITVLIGGGPLAWGENELLGDMFLKQSMRMMWFLLL